jgi:hypothetical protein
MHPAEMPLQLDEVLPPLQLLDELAPRAFVTLGERLEDAVALEEAHDRVQALLQVSIRANDRHARMVTRGDNGFTGHRKPTPRPL